MAGGCLAAAQATGDEPATVGSDSAPTGYQQSHFRREMAGATGLEPATFGVTGRRSNQLSYAPAGAVGS